MSIMQQSSKADLSKAYYGDTSGAEFVKKINTDFTAFLRNRALLVKAAMQQLTNGAAPDLHSLWAGQMEAKAEEAVV